MFISSVHKSITAVITPAKTIIVEGADQNCKIEFTAGTLSKQTTVTLKVTKIYIVSLCQFQNQCNGIWLSSKLFKPRHEKMALRVFLSKWFFSFFWVYIILRLVCENFMQIVYTWSSFSANVTTWCSCNDTQIVKLFLSFNWIWTSYWLHSVCLVVILKLHTIPMLLDAVKTFVNWKAFSSKHVPFSLPRKYDVIAQLRHSYA